MIGWLVKHWGWLAAGVVVVAYFAFYVLAMREQRALPSPGKSRLPCDRC